MLIGVRPPRIHLPFAPLAQMAMIVTGPLSAVSKCQPTALVVEAHRQAKQTNLLVTDAIVDPNGRTAHFVAFASERLAEMESRPWSPDMRRLESQLDTLRAHHPAHSLEWVITFYGQGLGSPEFARGSYTHNEARP